MRLAFRVASASSLPLSTWPLIGGMTRNMASSRSASMIDDRLRGGVVGHRRDVDGGELLHVLQRQVHFAAEPLHAERKLAGIALGVGDEFQRPF